VATNLPEGAASTLLAPLCAAGRPNAFNCSDLSTLGARATLEWRALLRGTQASGPASPLSAATAALLVEQQIGASAGRGFFSTSKFCGPPGYRRSTFSEGIALRWQLRQGKNRSLCAHAMENALLQGKAAHAEFVY